MTKPDLNSPDSPLARKLRSIYQLYLTNQSLAKVGKVLGLSRERIRQLLEQGEHLGLFQYRKLVKSLKFPVTKEKIIKDYEKVLQLNKVAEINGLSPCRLRRLIYYYHITSNTLSTIQVKKRIEKCFMVYRALHNQLNHGPSAMELRKSKAARKLYSKILRLWPSFQSFQRDFKKYCDRGTIIITHLNLKRENPRHDCDLPLKGEPAQKKS